MNARRIAVGILVLVTALGCQKRSSLQEQEAGSSPAESMQTTTPHATATEPAGTPRETAPTTPGYRSGVERRIVLIESSANGRPCVVVEEPRTHAAYGDRVMFVSRLKQTVTIDINGTSPMTRGHFEVKPGGTDGDVIGYNNGAYGNREFYYSLLPRACKSGSSIVVDGNRK